MRRQQHDAASDRADPRPASATNSGGGGRRSAPARLVHRALPTRQAQAFARWGVGSYAVVTGVLLLAVLRRTEGRLVYVLDDPAIHMSMARTLAEHGTWGVEAGRFESASSAPLWTSLLAVVHVVAPWMDELVPLLLNAVAALATIVLLGGAQSSFRPSRRRPLDALAVSLLTVVVLFLPAATFVGMEHLLHLALVLAALRLVLRDPDPTRGWASRAAPYVIIALATLTRLETAFVAAGLAVGMLATIDRHADDRGVVVQRRLGQAVAVGLSSAVPLVAFMVFNKVMGGAWLPNSIVAKSSALTGERAVPPLRTVFDQLTTDPVLAVLVASCLVAAIAGWRARPGWLVAAVGVPVATLLHCTFADVGWYERYQLYLVGLAVLTLLVAATDLLPASDERLDTADVRPIPYAALLVAVLMIFSATKASLTVEVPNGVADTYEQRYQAGRFLARYYETRPVATGELGYVSLFHDGPITDLYGLGDHEVLEARIDIPSSERPDYWRDLAIERGFRVAAVYPMTLGFETPEEWVLVGTWTLPRNVVSAFHRQFQLWATVPEEVAPLIGHLEDFEDELPPGVTQEVNELAQVRADILMAEQEG